MHKQTGTGFADGDFQLLGGTGADDVTAVESARSTAVGGGRKRLCAEDVRVGKKQKPKKPKCFSLSPNLTVARQAVGNSCPPAFAYAYFIRLLRTIGKSRVRALSLFSGICGIEEGLLRAARELGIEVELVLVCESNDALSPFLSHRYPTVINVGSILPDSIPDSSSDSDDYINPRIVQLVKDSDFIDVVMGGWVCKQNSVISHVHRSRVGVSKDGPKKSSDVEWNSLVWTFKDVCECVCKHANGGILPYIFGENTNGAAVGFFTAALETLFPVVFATRVQGLDFELLSSRKRVVFTSTELVHEAARSPTRLCDALLSAEQSDALGLHVSDKSVDGTMNDIKKGTGQRRWHSSGHVTYVDPCNDIPVKAEHLDKDARIPIRYGGRGYMHPAGWDAHLQCILGSFAKGAPNNVVVKKFSDGKLGAFILHVQEALVAVGFDPLYLCTCGECSVVVPAQ